MKRAGVSGSSSWHRKVPRATVVLKLEVRLVDQKT